MQVADELPVVLCAWSGGDTPRGAKRLGGEALVAG